MCIIFYIYFGSYKNNLDFLYDIVLMLIIGILVLYFYDIFNSIVFCFSRYLIKRYFLLGKININDWWGEKGKGLRIICR